MKDALERAHEITNLIKYSPHCQQIFYTFKSQGRSGRYGHGRRGFGKTAILIWAWFLESHSFVAITMSSCEVPLPDLGESHNQPGDYSFPSQKFGKSNVVSRAFQSSWFARWK